MNIALLIADPDEAFRTSLGDHLAARGYDVVLVGGGLQALAALEDREFDVVLADGGVPGASGIAVLRSAKETSPECEVIVMTGHPDIDDAIACMRGGAFDYLKKPITVTDVAAVVSRAVEEREHQVGTALYEASRAILDAREPQRLLEVIVAVSMAQMNADDVSVMLPGDEGELYVAYSHTLSPDIRGVVRIALGDRICGWVAQTGEPVLLNHALTEDPRFADVPSHGRVRSSIVYPLIASEQRLVGVLSISRIANERPFRLRDMKTASVLASQTLLALENGRLLREAVQSERLVSVGQLAASVAHEINNPITYVLANQGYIAGHLIEPAVQAAFEQVGRLAILDEMRQAVAEIREGALRVRDIVREIGVLAQTGGTGEAAFDLNDAVRSALRLAGPQLAHIRIVESFGADVIARGNSGRISQVFVNLLVNAAHALADLEDRQVVVKTTRVAGKVLVQVADNGCGIQRENLPRVFESFFTTKPSTVGSGLGLAISREIARSHGGDINVESSVGVGTTFTVSLPYANAEPVRPRQAPTRLRTGEIERPMRILFVEDEPSIRRAYERKFSAGFELVIATDGAQAWEIIERGAGFELIICDIQMHNMSGIELFERVRASNPLLCRSFIFVTGGASDARTQAFLASIDNAVLLKPFEMRELEELIESRRPRHG